MHSGSMHQKNTTASSCPVVHRGEREIMRSRSEALKLTLEEAYDRDAQTVQHFSDYG